MSPIIRYFKRLAQIGGAQCAQFRGGLRKVRLEPETTDCRRAKQRPQLSVDRAGQVSPVNVAGGNFTDENYTETVPIPFPLLTHKVVHNFGGLTLGEELMHKFGASTVLTESLTFFPNLTDTGEYRGAFNFGTITKISKWLGWQNQFGDIYVSNPPTGKKQNDIIFTTGLNIALTHASQ